MCFSKRNTIVFYIITTFSNKSAIWYKIFLKITSDSIIQTFNSPFKSAGLSGFFIHNQFNFHKPVRAKINHGIGKCELHEVFERAFVVSNHLANNAQTKGMLRYDHFCRMRENAVFINTGRGAQVVEDDLVRALAERPDLTALLDVTYPEPPVENHPFYTLPNCLLTPHIAGSLGGEVVRMAEYMVDEYERLTAGVPVKYEVTLKMIQYFIRRACGNLFFQPHVMICIPSGITEVEEKAVLDAAREAGAQKTYLIEEPVAAAIGAGLNIYAPIGNMVVDIGGGTTDVAVLSLGGVVVSRSTKIAGDKFDEAIIRYVRRKYNVLIGERTAEAVKKQIGAVYDHPEAVHVEVKGRCIRQGLPKVITISSKEMIEALAEPVTAILDGICSVIERTPPELLGDILRNGIVMTGGGSLLYGFDQLVTRVTGIPTRVAKDAVSCVAIGTGKSLDHLDMLREGAINLSKERKARL